MTDNKNDEKDLIVWQPDDSGGNAVIAILAGELDFEEPVADAMPEPPVAPPPKKPIKIPNQ